MFFLKWTAIGRLVPLIAMVCMSQGAIGQTQVRVADPLGPDDAETYHSIEPNEPGSGFDVLARSFSKKKRSELINLKTYTDEEWERLETAVDTNRKACRKGDAEACKAAGDAYASGDGVWPVSAIAYILYKEACDAGLGAGCIAFVDLANTGYGYPEGGYEETNGLLEKACDLGDLNGCNRFANELRQNGPDPSDIARSDAILERTCAAGGDAACLSLSALLMQNERPEDDDGAAEMLREIDRLRSVCAPDEPQACSELGRALSNPLSPEYDPEAALQLLEASCRAGLGAACYDATNVVGRDDPARTQRINALLESGCENGHPEACFDLARSLEDGDAGTANIERAVALYSRLCDTESPGACAAESKYAGLVPTARIASADERFLAPYAAADAPDVLRPTVMLEVCFTGSERFRGKTYTRFQCDRGEKGVGSKAALPGQAPWQALLWRPEVMAGNRLSAAERVMCGGTLIAQGWVLTAAHCLTDSKIAILNGGHRIRLGVYYSRIDEGISFPILATIPHPHYDPSNKYVYDVALVQYDHRAGRAGSVRARANSIMAIRLDPLEIGERKIAKGLPVYSFGWGWTEAEKSEATDYLQIVKMELATESACASVTLFRNELGKAALCAAGKNREQTCYGDSGGPLVHYGEGGTPPVLIGVVSAGKKCGATGRPSQYTRIAAVKSWIASYVQGIR